ncbi:competence protein ComK [Schinkia azotoformans]|uniref:competence protein ComK n=1 Tax=Schinkia azotoformans TaxID=1454 RepID=UPI002DBB73EE|nr:competence protein ComK [Schinkia azotoformans]MEC1771891.1 competence protein ComK [Schinkia azotoformans]MED4366389.1 competence protein ComK [Schinkia azotoformans]
MLKILDDYEVNRSTMALLSVAHIDYCTIVVEENQVFYVRKTTTEIVKASCLEGGASYEGRRKAIRYRTGSKQKVPIAINPGENIYAFPTHSPKAFECNWIFFNHVKYISTIHLPNKETKSRILFKNGLHIDMNESRYILEKQMKRTAICILWLSPQSVRF